jgi:phenylpyruvate tautomerase PptA (4-oxalocrotonate tautomerase family)
MPLVRFDLVEGRDDKALKQLLDASHRAIVKAFDVHERDRYQIITQHPATELRIEDTGLGFKRSLDLVIVTLTSTQRSDQQKKKFYKLLVDELWESCGIAPNDIMVSIVTNGASDWSFGFGEAQFLTGSL